ncbi:hypothetical protein HPT25_20380 [Bacillus sp. BRMEA1]|uniref:hypothetical protein n=1 Tax=Neobacillus endophyticus TaxID=2738405 RepID=UPI001567A478|nr:hypothetical protein [Neobacillus endophyticus]NRD79720.1 hypothetical protein [Neobacillus endophyticus]
MHPTKAYASSVDPDTVATFLALVEAIVPNTPELSIFGVEQTVGAVELCLHEYLIWEMDHFIAISFGISPTVFPLAAPTAKMLNAGAAQFISSGWERNFPYYPISQGCPFAALSAVDRLQVMANLEQLQADLGALPPPYQYNGGFVKFIVDYLNRATMFGFYSEWSAYGTTRLLPPDQRVLNYFPISWEQVGYPGVSLGYRDFRGFLLQMEHNKGGPSDA